MDLEYRERLERRNADHFVFHREKRGRDGLQRGHCIGGHPLAIAFHEDAENAIAETSPEEVTGLITGAIASA